MRRFDFKIQFNYLSTEQSLEVAVGLLKVLRVKISRGPKDELLAGLADLKLSHGDFAVLLRRYTAMKSKPDTRQLLKDLVWEASFREQESKPIGFLANV